MGTHAHVIRAVKHGRARGGVRPTQPDPTKRTPARLELAQGEIINMFPRELPEKRPRDLVRRVRAALLQNSKWTNQGWGPISRTHVLLAWKALKKI